MVINPDDDVVFVMTDKDGKHGNVAVLQAGKYIPAPVWTIAQWQEYVNRRLVRQQNGQFLGLSLEENEK